MMKRCTRVIFKIGTAVFAVLLIFAFEHGSKNNNSVQTSVTADTVICEIKRLVEYEISAEKARDNANKQAFLSAGGEAENFVSVAAQVDFDILCITDNAVSFAIRKTSPVLSPYGQECYYNVDINTGRHLTLEDILGKDYKRIAADSITVQAMTDDTLAPLLHNDVNVFSHISNDRMFYLTDFGNTAVIVFDVGEIAAEAAGIIEFKIDVPQK